MFERLVSKLGTSAGTAVACEAGAAAVAFPKADAASNFGCRAVLRHGPQGAQNSYAVCGMPTMKVSVAFANGGFFQEGVGVRVTATTGKHGYALAESGQSDRIASRCVLSDRYRSVVRR